MAVSDQKSCDNKSCSESLFTASGTESVILSWIRTDLKTNLVVPRGDITVNPNQKAQQKFFCVSPLFLTVQKNMPDYRGGADPDTVILRPT